MRISIVIPCYGRPQRTRRIINNLLSQTINDWEAFVIGGGTMIGMGSVMTKKSITPPFSKMVGNPAKNIGDNFFVKDKLSNDEIEQINLNYIEDLNTNNYINK